ncbi:mycothiol transferase [Brachybacterium sp. DNPG3]
MPFLTPDTTDERDSLAVFAAQQIRQVAICLHALDPAQLGTVPSASSLSLGALARHCIFIADGIAAAVRAAPELPAADAVDPARAMAEGGLAPEALRADDTVDLLIAELERAADGLAAAIRAADPDTPMPVPDAPWFTGAEQWTVRWRSLHAVEEFARHAGHADILRESIDGRIAYELNALAAGESWPPAGWGA